MSLFEDIPVKKYLRRVNEEGTKKELVWNTRCIPPCKFDNLFTICKKYSKSSIDLNSSSKLNIFFVQGQKLPLEISVNLVSLTL